MAILWPTLAERSRSLSQLISDCYITVEFVFLLQNRIFNSVNNEVGD